MAVIMDGMGVMTEPLAADSCHNCPLHWTFKTDKM